MFNLRNGMHIFGEMSERPKECAWKAYVPQGTGGSNPPLSVFLQLSGSVQLLITQLRQDRKVAAVSD